MRRQKAFVLMDKFCQATRMTRIDKEFDTLEKHIKRIEKRSFACREDAELEIEKFQKQDFSKIKYHSIEI